MSTPGKRNLLAANLRHFHVVQPRADRQAGEIVALLEQLAEALAVLRRDLDHGASSLISGSSVAGLGRRDLERIGGVVVRQHRAVAIEDQPAVGDDRDDGDAVVLGQRVVVLVLQHLHVEEADKQQEEHEQHRRRRETARRIWKLCSSF